MMPNWGKSPAWFVQYSTKSAPISLHGSVYEFNRNKATFAANPYTEKRPGTGPTEKDGSVTLQ